MAQGAVHEKLWTPANVVTLLRICLVPVFVVAIISPWPEYFPFWADAEASKPWIAAGIFILLAATDGLDGYLARSRGEVTNFGKFIDPWPTRSSWPPPCSRSSSWACCPRG